MARQRDGLTGAVWRGLRFARRACWSLVDANSGCLVWGLLSVEDSSKQLGRLHSRHAVNTFPVGSSAASLPQRVCFKSPGSFEGAFESSLCADSGQLTRRFLQRIKFPPFNQSGASTSLIVTLPLMRFSTGVNSFTTLCACSARAKSINDCALHTTFFTALSLLMR